MRVAVVYSDYRSGLPSGEREVVKNECAALARAGVDVHLVSAATDEGLRDHLYPLRAAGRVATGFGASPLDRILDIAPDLVHVHNLFPNFGTRWLVKTDLPIVVTLHNYRSVCSEGSLFRDGSPCTLCPDGSSWSALRHRCYRGSVTATLPLAFANRRGLSGNPLVGRADLILLPSAFHRDLLTRYGLDPERSRASPNFVPDSRQGETTAPGSERNGWVYVGRLDDGKGVLPLVKSWPEAERLTIVGDGPLRDAVEASAGSAVEVLGQQSRSAVERYLRESEGLVFPSRHFESQPLVYLEALQAGTPIVAREGNAVAAAVGGERTGVTYADDSGIVKALQVVRNAAAALTEKCLQVFEARYSESAWRTRRNAEYADVLAGRRTG